jgi:hypothetical protein
MPDYSGRLVYTTRGTSDAAGAVQTPALIGVFDPATNTASAEELDGELVEVPPAIAPDGLFSVSDRALYGYRYDAAAGGLQRTFRQEYPRGAARKGGAIRFGSGSAPTLFADHLIAITDNADEQIHLWVYDRRPEPPGGKRAICDVPLFERGASANESSVLAAGRSLLVQNWYGPAEQPSLSTAHRLIAPGLMRIDVRLDESGCDVVWYSEELATRAPARLSTATGLIYAAMLDRAKSDINAFYLVAIDFETGKIVYRTRLGVGDGADVASFPTSLGPDGAIYQPVSSGLIRVQDRPDPAERPLKLVQACAHGAGRSHTPWAPALLATALAACMYRRARSRGKRFRSPCP